MANWLNILLKGKKVAGDIKFVKPQVHHTGTKHLINKFKKTVKNVKNTDDVMDRKAKAAREIHGYVKKHGGTKADEAAGAKLKGKK